ncbi:MAG: site-specific integrase [Bacilli bacterium]|nr:site-specific integrase [Bacilli bacterium]
MNFISYLNYRKDVIFILIRQAKNNECTKDGRSWYVDLTYRDLLGKRCRYHSKKFATRREAKDHEAEFKVKIKNQTEFTDLTFKDLIQEHYQYQQDKVKVTTLSNYRNMMVYLEPLENIKLESFNIRHFEMWRQFMNSKPISTRYKNGVYKYLKALMNFGTKWYDINFVKVYNKMTNFTNPNERKKEMLFYTLDEFQRFLSVETNLKFRYVFQTLFYCGLRNGELRGLTWNDIDFNRSTLTVNKNIVKVPDPKTGKPYTVTSPKTSSSYRTIPIPNFLLKDLSDLYNDDANYYGFRESWYVFGNIDPLSATTLLDRKTKNAFMARVKDIRIHDFRHSCASLLIDSGANITLVAKYLGHTKIDETLNTYSHMYQNRLDTIVNIIELQNSRLNNNVIETKPTILLEHKETLPEEESYDYEEYEIVKPKNKDDLVL